MAHGGRGDLDAGGEGDGVVNRRQFIKRATSALCGLAIFGRPVLRGRTKEMPVALGNRSVFATLWDEQGIKASDVRARIKETQNEQKEIERIARSLSNCDCSMEFHIVQRDCGKTTAERIDEFGRMCAAQRPELAKLPYPHYGSTRQEMERILAANPEMSKEQAFFQAVMEIAESNL